MSLFLFSFLAAYVVISTVTVFYPEFSFWTNGQIFIAVYGQKLSE